MRRKSLFWRLYLSYALIILLCLAVVGGYAGWELAVHTKGRLRTDLQARAGLAAAVFMPLLSQGAREAMQAKARELGSAAQTRVTLIAADGVVVADSHEDPSHMDNHGDRPEVKKALAGEIGVIERHSNTLKMEMLYVALPMSGPGGARYVIRAALPLVDVQARIRAIYVILGGGGLLAAMFALVLGYLVVRRITRPLREMEEQMRRAAEGDLKVKFWSETPDEIGRLAETMNAMVAQLDEKIRSLVRQRNEREAILTSMIEGVVAVDSHERVLMVNQAARVILSLPAERLEGRPILELVRNTKLQAFLGEVLSADTAKEGEVELLAPEKRVIGIMGAPLRDEAGSEIGCVVVLNDVTRLRALERMRSEFVANVSHELKTPITTIKGYIETLREGALKDPDKAAQFLDTVARHADRLNAIVEDLLSLSRIESDARSIAMEPLDLRDVAARSVTAYRSRAAARNVQLVSAVPPDPAPVLGNANLLEQALGNVLDNAVKFSAEGKTVKVSLRRSGEAAFVEVADEGIGIPAADLPHVFERFYRVDKARSRELGGTGLGLAIVKHIILAHKGEVTAESALGKGSVFTIRLPVHRSA